VTTGPDAGPDVPVPVITAVRLSGTAHREELPLLVLGPAEGHTAVGLWAEVAAGLVDAFDVLAWDLPGHGYNAPAPPGSSPPSTASLAAGVASVVDDVAAQRGELGRPCAWAGIGVGAEVALHLHHAGPGRVTRAIVLDDVPPAERTATLRHELLGEEPDAQPAPALDERTRALVVLAVAAATGRGVEGATSAAVATGVSAEQVDAVLVLAEEAR